MITPLASSVHIARRFTRAIRVDSDLGDPAALEGYVCSQSAADALLLMGRHKETTGHCAFTWTGPYGSGKSSLAVALAAVLAGPRNRVKDLLRDLKPEDAEEICRLFRPSAQSWTVVPVVGRRGSAEEAIADGITCVVQDQKLSLRKPKESLSSWIGRLVNATSSEGLVIVVDEMGKFLEHAASDGGDVHLFQDLAEISARSGARFILIGILHQAFDEYAHRLAREARDEWMKVQGRFLDISISLAGEEQIELIARAIESKHKPTTPTLVAQEVAQAIRGKRSGPSAPLAERLTACWPLHPIVASLLGPISRRRFGQSQRSIFGFLTSAEPFGLQEHLAKATGHEELFAPEQLWDYLRANLEPAILSSPDGHRWATAVEAIDRCEARSGGRSHLGVLKGIALLDLFKDRSGLQATPQVVAQCLPLGETGSIEASLIDLMSWSVIVFRKHSGTYAIYAGSDFDIEQATEEARRNGVTVDYRNLARQASLKPILAKRHYEATGALRWFELDLAPLHEADDRVTAYKPAAGAAGLFLLLVSGQGEPPATARKICKRLARVAGGRLIVVGWTRDSFRLREMAIELASLEHVRANRPELEGDPVARREVDARISRLAAELEDRLSDAIDLVDWVLPAEVDASRTQKLIGPAALSILASELANWRYPASPQLRNELVNRTRPSSNAAAATRALLRAMVEHADEARLGLEGYPPEAGLYASLLESTGLHKEVRPGWRFVAPDDDDAYTLAPAWRKAEQMLKADDAGHTFAELYVAWRAPPFGVRDGLLPILAVAFLLSVSERAAVYLDGVFRPQFDAYLIDRILQEPSAVRVRWVELSDLDSSLVAELSRRLSDVEGCVVPSPLEVAKALVRQVRTLPNWTLRTNTLSPHATALRNLGRNSHDPNQLLFEDLPRAIGGNRELTGTLLAIAVDSARVELQNAYPQMLNDIIDTLYSELRFKGAASKNFGPLQRRASAVKGLSGNFRLDALATRLAGFDGMIEDIEGIASLAANKPPRDWVDRDVDAARIELAALAQQFLRAEGFGHLKGRADGRLTMVVYVSDPEFPAPVASEIELDPSERLQAELLVSKLAQILSQEGAPSNVALGALAKLGLQLSAHANIHEPTEV